MLAVDDGEIYIVVYFCHARLAPSLAGIHTDGHGFHASDLCAMRRD